MSELGKYLEKQAMTPEELIGNINTITGNPLVRSAALGTGAYFGSKYLYNKSADKMAKGYMDQITDPNERKKEWDAFVQRKKKMQPWITGTATALGAGLPLLGTLGPHAAGVNAGWGEAKSWGNALFNNQIDAYKNIQKMGTEYMSSSSPYVSGDDLMLGKHFVMPDVRPPSFWDVQDIPKHQSLELLYTQQPVLGRDNTYAIADGLHQAESNNNSSMVSTGDIFKGLVRAGVGAAVGYGLANVIGTVFAQPSAVKSKMAHYGAIGGAILNSGIGGYIGKKLFG